MYISFQHNVLWWWIIIGICLIVHINGEAMVHWDQYHSDQDIPTIIHPLMTRHAAIVSLFSLGNSVQGRPIWCIKIGAAPVSNQVKVAVKLFAAMHGDEVVGRELLLRLAYDLITTNNNVLRMVDVYIIPTVNPDGYATRQRENARRVDLNRDFPDQYYPQSVRSRHQPETQALLNLSLASAAIPFVLSMGLHGGAVVVNYPWDGVNPSGGGGEVSGYAASPDDVLYKFVASRYANLNPVMRRSREFPGGITNGAKWYSLYGGAQDWDYVWNDCISLTAELTNSKQPPASQLTAEWLNNRDALYDFINLATWCGVQGKVMTMASRGRPSQPILSAQIEVAQNAKIMHVNSRYGTFMRLLAPGDYQIRARAPGYKTSEWKSVRITTTQKQPVSVIFQLNLA
jgi:carboxypeptidase D